MRVPFGGFSAGRWAQAEVVNATKATAATHTSHRVCKRLMSLLLSNARTGCRGQRILSLEQLRGLSRLRHQPPATETFLFLSGNFGARPRLSFSDIGRRE